MLLLVAWQVDVFSGRYYPCKIIQIPSCRNKAVPKRRSSFKISTWAPLHPCPGCHPLNLSPCTRGRVQGAEWETGLLSYDCILGSTTWFTFSNVSSFYKSCRAKRSKSESVASFGWLGGKFLISNINYNYLVLNWLITSFNFSIEFSMALACHTR